MEFKEFYYGLKKPRREAFAKACNVSVGYLNLIAGGHRTASTELSIDIERESGGMVRCETMRQDVDWAYIRGSSASEDAA